MKTFYVITFYNVNKFACEEGGFSEAVTNFGTYSSELYPSRAEAFEARKKLIEKEIEKETSENGHYSKKDGYEVYVSNLGDLRARVNVIEGDELINQTVYEIQLLRLDEWDDIKYL